MSYLELLNSYELTIFEIRKLPIEDLEEIKRYKEFQDPEDCIYDRSYNVVCREICRRKRSLRILKYTEKGKVFSC